MDSYGNGVGYFEGIASEYYCQQKCQEDAACQYFTYNKNSAIPPVGACYLKSAMVPLTSYTGLISGPKYCGNYY